jgi:hypothetical protein
MKAETPPAVTRFFLAHNTGHTDEVMSLFTTDAIVHDEEREHRGAAIKDWLDKAVVQYKPHAEAVDISSAGCVLTVTANVSGTFPGSPVQLRYHFTLKGNEIAALTIGT